MQRVLMFLFVALALPGTAAATPILDANIDQKGTGVFNQLGAAQSFTVLNTGLLTQIDVELYSSRDLTSFTIDLFEFNAVDGPTTLLASSTLTNLDTDTQAPGTWFSFPFAVPVTVGDDLAIRMSLYILQGPVIPTPLNVYWVSDPNAYFGGSVWFGQLNPGDPFWYERSDIDNSFRVYVDPDQPTGPPAVPEPSTWLLLGTGLAAIAARRRFAKHT